jgi:HME family heavy-metal exporter
VRTPDDEIEVPIAGAELDPLAGAARELRKALATTTGVGAVGVAGAGVEPRAFVDIDAQALTRAGVHAADVDELVRIARGGVAVARLNDGPRDVPVVVRLPDDGGRPASLGRLVVGSPGGAVPLASVAAITMRLAATGIVHRDGERAVVVWVRPRAGANRAALRLSVWVAAESVKLPPGVRLVRPRQ